MTDTFSASTQYPLGENAADRLQAASGRPLSEVTLDAAAAGELSAADLSISAQALQAQAKIARDNDYKALAANLTRAAELSSVPNEVLLKMYEMLRPQRATYADLMAMAQRLESEYDAPSTAMFVREAAEIYQARNILRPAADER